MTAAEQIARFLERADWSTMRLAVAANLHESTVSKLSRGDRPMTLLSAIRLEVATVAAKKRGEIRVAPLRAADLLREHEELANLVKAIAA